MVIAALSDHKYFILLLSKMVGGHIIIIKQKKYIYIYNITGKYDGVLSLTPNCIGLGAKKCQYLC